MEYITLLDAEAVVRQRCDLEDTNEYVTSAEIRGLISASYKRLWALLAEADPDRYVRRYSLQGSGSSSLPGQYLGTHAVWYYDGSDLHEVPRVYGLDVRDYENSDSALTGANVSYNRLRPQFGYTFRREISGSVWYTNLLILPDNDTSSTFYHDFIMQPNSLTSDSSTIETFNGFEEYIYSEVCMRLYQKQDLNASHWAAERQEQIDKIEALRELRNATETGRVRRVGHYAPGDHVSYSGRRRRR